MTFGRKLLLFFPFKLLQNASDKLTFLQRCEPDHHLRPAELTGLSRLATPHLQPTLSLYLSHHLSGSRPSLLCILGSLGGVLPAWSRGMRATGRPNEVVSLRRIVMPQFRSVLPFWGLGSGSDLLLRGCRSAPGLKQQHDFICGSF